MYVCCHIMTTLSWKVFPNVFVELKLFFRRWKEEKNSFSLDFLAWNCVTFSLYPMCLVVQIYFIGTAQQYPIPEFGNIDYELWSRMLTSSIILDSMHLPSLLYWAQQPVPVGTLRHSNRIIVICYHKCKTISKYPGWSRIINQVIS